MQMRTKLNFDAQKKHIEGEEKEIREEQLLYGCDDSSRRVPLSYPPLEHLAREGLLGYKGLAGKGD